MDDAGRQQLQPDSPGCAASASHVLTQVEHGKAFIITRNGKPIAELRPLEDSSLAERIAAVFAVREKIAQYGSPEPILAADESWREIIHRGHHNP